MPIIYIKTIENSECEITNFKDVTIVTRVPFLKQIFKRIKYMSFNYISFDINNIGEHEFDNIEIVLPYNQNCISELKRNAKECPCSPVYSNDIFTKLEFKMENSLKKGDNHYVEIGFKVTLTKPEKEFKLHFYNLLPPIIESIGDNKILNVSPICTETMKLYLILPKPFKEKSAAPSAEWYNREDFDSKEISDLESRLRRFFRKDEMFSKKNFHEIFEWTKRQLTDLPDKLVPDSKGRVIRFRFGKKDSWQMFGYDCSYGMVLGISLAVHSLILAIFKC